MKLFNSPSLPSQENIELIKNYINKISSDQINIKEWFKGYAHRHLNRIAYDLELIRAHTLPKEQISILEVGAVPLLLSLPLHELGYNLTCLDLNFERFSKTIKSLNIPNFQCDIEKEKIPFKDDSCKIIIFNEIFEHLRINPIFTFSEIKRVMDPEGYLYLSTPNLRSLEGFKNLIFNHTGYALCGEVYKEFKKLEDHGHVGHIREYTYKDVVIFLESMGFEVEKVIFRGESRAFGLIGKMVTKIFPSLKPFCTVVARKSGNLSQIKNH